MDIPTYLDRYAEARKRGETPPLPDFDEALALLAAAAIRKGPAQPVEKPYAPPLYRIDFGPGTYIFTG